MTFAPAPQTVEDLLGTLTIDDVKAYLLAFLSVPENPVTDWESGAVLRTMWELEALLQHDLLGAFLIAQAKNAYPDTAVKESLTMIAHAWHAVTRALPSAATQNVTIRCTAGAGPYTSAQVATLVGLTGDSGRYAVTTPGPLSSGGTTTVVMTAMSPARARALVVSLESALPGVSVQSAAVASPGSDGDGDSVVRAAMDARFGDIDAIPAQDRVIAYALQADNTIARFRRDADPAYPGGVLLTLASATGGVLAGVVTAVQARLNKMSPVTDVNTAQSATTREIGAGGTVRVRRALGPTAMAAADAAWLSYIRGSQIGGKVLLQSLREAVAVGIRSDPTSNFTGASLAGAGGDGNVVLASTEVPITTPGDGEQPLTAELTWELT